MTDRLANLSLRALSAVLIVVGLVMILVGYIGVRDHNDIVLQIPYFMSGGVGGLALMGLGALALVQYQMRVQTERFDEITQSLDEWKTSALAEVRSFLEQTEIEVEVLEPARREAARTRATSRRAS